MASETRSRSNIEIVREYAQRGFNQHNPDVTSQYLAPEVRWHGQTLGTERQVGETGQHGGGQALGAGSGRALNRDRGDTRHEL
ncbi:hypothetical protein EV644_15014 [Kribbella orskensis]|uniref:Tn3 transposase DDE domain-containing protein n=1 Tax=Kribbella orskensis TaxID=2512216 RepID=A0ABY2B6I7_9ACTN|nr:MULTISPECIES: hypothetical protein [Kribbella]TCN37861.1 hypothetical protein EV642_11010 [Kribbella sp. VKM Ac-2500]TCO08069.1 hypothetical protein EV644_15014 [Kribbella orskensis]